uniref:Chorein N-terminal domain-containing protein n=1 Tax=Biomphalaria glabrata TaxID=6526 RepID=A0A2C9K5E4_BIOGL
MFKLESYITPLLMGYLDKYVKLRQEDFQLSLWGGDAVLNNLDLRLDELEKVLQLPVMFQSGHIHELRLHVPWTKLGSEPVVITINTVECILKVRDTAYDGVSRSPLKSSQGKSPQAKSKRRSQPTEDLPPGYLQSIVNRIINNVTFIINNLILKFVEDDIVLSVNVKSAECYSVDKEWNSAFVDLTSDDLALRKVVNFADLTVCLDKTNASGHIESYQEPMAYRCAVSCRLVMEYDSVSSKLPSVTRFNVFCDTLNLSLTDTQLPMFIRFIELCIAMYYGSLDIPTSTAGSTTEDSSSVDQTVLDIEPKYDDKLEQTSDQGWASWAWSYVPQILPTEDEDMEGGEEQRGNKGRPSPLILCIGIYIHHGTIVFKLTEKSKDSSELPHRKMHFQPFLRLSVDGVGVEVLLQGLLFCSIQCGLTSLKLTTCGNCICDVADEKIARCNTLLSGGEELSNKIGLNYISNSLFDDVPRDTRHYIVDSDEHRQVYTEQYALQRFGAFWVDNLYSLENNDIRHGASSHSSETDNSDTVFLKEFSTLRFVFGHTHLNVSSTLYHRVSKFIHCATNHQYQPYGSSKQVATTPEERPKPSEDQVKSLEEFIPTTLLHMMFINPTVTILQAEHSYCDVAKKNYKYRQKKRDAKGTEEGHPNPPIPAIVLSTSRFDLQITKPMYPGRLVKLVTAIAGPSSNLLHHCHSHLQVKLFSFQAGLQRAKVDGTVSGTLTILSPCSFALYLRSLVLPKLWMNSSLPVKEWMYEVPNASVNINKASVLMCCRIVSTWLSSMYPQGYDPVLNDSLRESSHQSYPLLEIGLSGLEFKSCNSPLVSACVGSLSLLHVFLYSPGIAGKMSVIPILYGPNDTSKICNPELFKQPVLDKSELHCDCITATFQKPKHTGVSEAQALALVDCQGLCFWLDPGLISWFHYCPQPRPGHKTEQIAVTLDLSLAQMTSPLNAVSQASVHSTSSPSHPGISRQQTSTSQPPQGRSSSTTEEKDKELKEPEKKTLGQILAQYFPLLRMFHVQLHLCATVSEMLQNVVSNTIKMTKDCTRQFVPNKDKTLLTPSFSHKKSVSSTQRIESIKSVDVTEHVTTDISEDFSHEGSPLHENIIDDREEAGVKLTLWLQLMFPRLQFTLYGLCPFTQLESGLSVFMDHFDLSMDSQSVYSKAKVTLGSISIQHAVKSGGTWCWTDPDGIVLSFSHQLPSNLHLATNKTWISEASSLKQALHPENSSSRGDKKHGVLSVTFTRALCKNVKKRLRRANIELPPVNELESPMGLTSDGEYQSCNKLESMEMYYHQYLSEFCVKSEPFDIILRPEVILLITGLLNGMVKGEKKKLVHPPSVKLELPVQSNSNVAESTSVHNLPLIYADLGKIRLFLLKSDHDHTKDVYKASQNVGSEDGSSAWAAHSIDSKNPQDKVSACEETHGAECKHASDICCAMNHDFVVAQINSCLIQPHAENPLPRTAQQKDVFMYAVQAGSARREGNSGVWQELIYEMCQAALRKPSTNSMVQIPALDWNTFLMDSPSHERKEIQLLPFSTPFDFSLVVAPPISYIPQGDESDLNKKAWLICGLSTELNLTSDLDLYISTSQVKLISDFAGQISLCFVPKQDSIAAHPTLPPGITSSPLLVHSSKKEPLLGGGGFDSGVESDLSTLTFDKGAQRLGGLRQISQPVSVRTDEQKLSGLTKDEMGGTTNMLSLSTPLDILVTASRISCSVYTYKILEEKFTLEMPVFTDNQQTDYGPAGALGATRNRKEYNAKDNLEDILSGKPRRSSSSSTDKNDDVDTNNFDPGDDGTFNFMKSHAEDSLKRILPEGSVCIVPFVYLYVTQPHCLVSSHSEKEVKIEGSCYDVLIKGSSDKHITAVDELHTLPDCSDYNVHWMETRPGQVHPHTGIPPSLLTIRFSIQPSVPDTINVQLERPLRFKLSRLAVEQTIAFIQQVTQMFASVETNKESWEIGNEGTDKEETHSKRQYNTSNGILTKVERVEVSTCQIVLVFEMSDTVGAVVSSEGLDLEVDLTREGTGNTPVSGHLQLKDLVLKTAYQKKCRPLLGPLTVSVDAGLSWIPSPGDLYLPQIFLGIETGVILVSFGQEHLFSLTELVKQLQDMMKNLMTEKKQKVVSSKQSQEAESLTKDFVQDRTHDDLRCGKFQFIDGSECSNLLPNAHEIVFSSGGVDTGENSCMTWCYSHPRVITAMHLIPVPFYLSASSQSLESSSHEETSTVPCVLQYWDEMNERFNDLIRFSLSENEPVTVDLPDPRRANKSMCISARMWRVVLLQFTQGEEEGLTKKSDAAVLPASLAACMCVDSAFLPSIIPTLQVTMSIPATYLQLCHHLDYNGSDTPGKLSLYSMSPDLAEQQVFAVLKIDKLTGTSSYVTGVEAEIKMKVSFVTSLDVLEYGYLKMDTVITPAALSLSLDINNTTSKKQEINCFLLCDKFRVEIGKSTVHTLNMAVLSWSSFNPQGSGSHLIFSHYIVCNNTASALRFGQAGTDENILLYSREMYGYSWRSCTVPQMLHLCMDKPAWKWTEPFSVEKEGSSVHSVTAREQSYVVIIKVTKLSNLQTQITVCGQLVVCNRLSQPISMRVSLGANSSKSKPSGNFDRLKIASYFPLQIPLPDSSAYFHVLCRVFCQHFYGMPQKLTATARMIMLTPLYVVRTHLPCPLYIHLNSPKHTQEMKVYSQGREFQLHCTGGDVTHEMAFRLGNDMMLSDPAIKLSTGLISQLTRSQLASVDIEKMCEQRMDTIHSSWPYLTEESDNIDIDTMTQRFRLDQSRLASNATFEENLEPQPSIDLNIRLSEYIPGCDTLLVEVTPVFLVHNDTDLDIVIAGTEDRMWCIKSGHTMAPPLQKDKFKLAIKYQDMVSEQKVITMSNESQDYRRYNDEIGKVLFVDGYVHASFQIMFQDTQRCEMIFITLTSDIKHDIRVICVRERFALSNQTGMSLKVKLLALPLNPNPISMSETEAVTVVSHGKTKDAAENDAENGPSCGSSSFGSSHVPHPLLQWTTAVSRSEDSNDHISGSEEQEKTFVCYVSFSAVDKDVGSSSKPWVWSSPVRLVSSKDGHKATTSIPDIYRHPDQSGAEEWTPVTHAVCVVTQLVNGVTYVVVNNDHNPACVVENLCPFGLEFGQMCDKLIGNGAVIQEQVELVSDLPWLPPGGWAHYTPPVVNSDFLTRESIVIPKLHFRAIDVHLHGLPTIGPSDWSSATQITGNMDAFVRLPGFCDLKVMIQHIGMVTHLIVRPVSKAEITAKEIRSRIKDQSDVQQPKSKPSKMKKTGGTYSFFECHFNFSEKCNMLKGPQISLSLGLLCRSLTLVIQDELNEDSLSELMCLHLNDFFFACYSDAINFDDSGTKTSYIASAGSLQMDNQQYGAGAYDFPVTFLPQKQKDSEVKSSEPLDMGEVRSMQELHALLKCDSFLQFQLVTFSDSTWKQSVIESVDILMKPFSLYIDDTFVYRLVEELENFAPRKLGGSFREAISQKALHRKLPNVVRLNSYTLCHPIRIKQLTLQPIKMLLSVHASLKLFLASDHTPLNVGKFERSNVYSTLPRLSHVLTMHYASAAIFRAAETFLTRLPIPLDSPVKKAPGPRVRPDLPGMITSVTNFASSVSRNMDRLSFDTSHLARQEENRRNRPVGVSDGLKQGLTGFGLSLLGMCKNLSFILGILHGTGLGQLPTRLEKPNVRKRLDLPDGPFKYLVKNFSQLPTPELLLVAPAVTFDLMEAEVKVVLLLTPDVLVVVNCDEDAQLQALSISELDCKVDFVESGGRLVLQWVDQIYRSSALEQTRTSTKDRVAAFIDTQKISDLPTDGPHVTLEHLDLKTQSEEQDLTMAGHIVATVPSSSILTDTKIPGLHPASVSPQYEFELEPYWLDLFVTLFRLAKNRLQGKGFPV